MAVQRGSGLRGKACVGIRNGVEGLDEGKTGSPRHRRGGKGGKKHLLDPPRMRVDRTALPAQRRQGKTHRTPGAEAGKEKKNVGVRV